AGGPAPLWPVSAACTALISVYTSALVPGESAYRFLLRMPQERRREQPRAPAIGDQQARGNPSETFRQTADGRRARGDSRRTARRCGRVRRDRTVAPGVADERVDRSEAAPAGGAGQRPQQR